jgi:hypothetical protein
MPRIRTEKPQLGQAEKIYREARKEREGFPGACMQNVDYRHCEGGSPKPSPVLQGNRDCFACYAGSQ